MKRIGQFTLTAGLAAVLVSSSLPVMAEAGSSADRISQKIDIMTLEQKIGQMIMPDFRQWNGSNHTSLAPNRRRNSFMICKKSSNKMTATIFRSLSRSTKKVASSLGSEQERTYPAIWR